MVTLRPGVEISYCDKEPLTYDLTIKLTQDGIKLVFDSLSQRLKIIEIYDLSLVRLKYWWGTGNPCDKESFLSFDTCLEKKLYSCIPTYVMLSFFLSDLLFNCPDVSPTIEQIDQSFGATRKYTVKN